MANTYSFKINAVDVYTSQDNLEKVIYNVHWTYSAQNADGISASMIGVQTVDAPNPENFVSFEQLVQSDIISWIEPMMSIDEMKSNLDKQIEEKITPSRQTLTVPESLDSTEEVATEEAAVEEAPATEEEI